jgi:predicted kinase
MSPSNDFAPHLAHTNPSRPVAFPREGCTQCCSCESLNHSPRLVLIRGVPGSGKTTLAKSMNGYVNFEADQYFETANGYAYDARHIREAHRVCQERTRRALKEGLCVVVSNTFTTLAELEPYFTMSDSFRIVEATGRWQNVHDVPQHRVDEMRKRWEPTAVIAERLASRNWWVASLSLVRNR